MKGRGTSWVDTSGRAHVIGTTLSANFPTTPNARRRRYPGHGAAFVTRLDAAGTATTYSTYLGGDGGATGGHGIAGADLGGFAAGDTEAGDFFTRPRRSGQDAGRFRGCLRDEARHGRPAARSLQALRRPFSEHSTARSGFAARPVPRAARWSWTSRSCSASRSRRPTTASSLPCGNRTRCSSRSSWTLSPSGARWR